MITQAGNLHNRLLALLLSSATPKDTLATIRDASETAFPLDPFRWSEIAYLRWVSARLVVTCYLGHRLELLDEAISSQEGNIPKGEHPFKEGGGKN